MLLKFVQIFLFLHVFFGSLSLITFWLTFFFRKKIDLHQKMGTFFYTNLNLNLIFSALLCLILFYDPLLKYPAFYYQQSRVRTLMLIYLSLMPYLCAKISIEIQKRKELNITYLNFLTIIFSLLGGLLCIGGVILKLKNVVLITATLTPIITILYLHLKKHFVNHELYKNSKITLYFHLRFMCYTAAALHVATLAGGPAVRYTGLENSFTGLNFYLPFFIFLIIDLFIHLKYRLK